MPQEHEDDRTGGDKDARARSAPRATSLRGRPAGDSAGPIVEENGLVD